MSQATRDRIDHAMEALGYVPSASARQLKLGHAHILGLIVPSVANPFWGEFVRATEDAAIVKGYGVLVGSSERLPDREQLYAEAMYGHGIRAIVFGSSPVSISYLAPLTERGVHIIAFDRRFYAGDFPGIDSVTIDNVRAGELVTEFLIELGHRRIGFLSAPIKTASRRDRLEGYRDALVTAGISFDRSLVWEGTKDSAFGDFEGAVVGQAGAATLLGRSDPPTAIVCINDFYALGACAGARQLGLAVPDDVSIVGFDDTAFAALAQPPLTTIRQPIPAMAEAAVELVVSKLKADPEADPIQREFPPELVVRESTAPPRARAATTQRSRRGSVSTR